MKCTNNFSINKILSDLKSRSLPRIESIIYRILSRHIISYICMLAALFHDPWHTGCKEKSGQVSYDPWQTGKSGILRVSGVQAISLQLVTV
jgi:hypothetical protein